MKLKASYPLSEDRNTQTLIGEREKKKRKREATSGTKKFDGHFKRRGGEYRCAKYIYNNKKSKLPGSSDCLAFGDEPLSTSIR